MNGFQAENARDDFRAGYDRLLSRAKRIARKTKRNMRRLFPRPPEGATTWNAKGRGVRTTEQERKVGISPRKKTRQQNPQSHGIEGLEQVAVETGGVGPFDILTIPITGGGDKIGVRSVLSLAQPPGHFAAIQAGQANIDQTNVGLEGGSGGEGGRAVSSFAGIMAPKGEKDF